MFAKVLSGVALLSVSLISTAQAAVLLEKYSQSGGEGPAESRFEASCAIHTSAQANKGVLIKKTSVAGIVSTQTTPIQFNTTQLNNIIALASKGKITSTPLPLDVATHMYVAYQKQTNGSNKAIALYGEDGDIGKKTINNSVAAKSLVNYLEMNCENKLRF